MAILIAITVSITVSVALALIAVIAQTITAVTVLNAGEYVYSPARPPERVEVDRLALLKGLVNLLAKMGPLPIEVGIDVSEFVVEGCRPSDVLVNHVLVVSDEVVARANARDGLAESTVIDWVDARSTVVRDSSDLVLPARDEITTEIERIVEREDKLLLNILADLGISPLDEEEGPLYLLSDEGLTLVVEEEEIPFLLADEELDGSCWELLTQVEEEGYAPTFIN